MPDVHNGQLRQRLQPLTFSKVTERSSLCTDDREQSHYCCYFHCSSGCLPIEYPSLLNSPGTSAEKCYICQS
jgi:hypothetical protein